MARRRTVNEVNIFGNAAFMDAMANTVGALIFLLLMVVVVTVALKLNYFDLAIKTPDRLPDGVAGKPYDVVLAGFGGNQPYSWKVVSGLPRNGLELKADSAVVRETRQQRDYVGNVPHVFGTPVEATRQPIVFEVELSDTPVIDEKTGKVIIPTKIIKKRFELAIQPASYTPSTLVIKTTTLPVAAVGKEYSVFTAASGGEPPYEWTADGTPLKGMLKIDPGDGRLSGIPGESGEWPLRLSVRDKSGRTAQSNPILFRAANYRDAKEVEQELEKLKRPLRVMTRTLPDAILGKPYELMLAAEGGVPPYKWSPCGPAGLRGLAITSDGRLSGTAQAGGAVKACVTTEGGDSAESSELKLTVVTVPPPPPPLRLFSPARGGAQ